jgi:hypothetical protein
MLADTLITHSHAHARIHIQIHIHMSWAQRETNVIF